METILFAAIGMVALCLGFFIYKNPSLVIEWQKKFYALINWRMEPISMEKEIRNTMLMGLFLIVVTTATFIFYWIQRT
jgi:hypothetical protein